MKNATKTIGNYLVIQQKRGLLIARDTRGDGLVELVKLPKRLGPQKEAYKTLLQALEPILSLKHESLQTLEEVFEEKRDHYLALRFLEAAPLAKVLKELKSLSVDEIHRLANQVGTGLSQAHAFGVVHGNLGMPAIMVDKSGNYLLRGLTDLPISKYCKSPIKYRAGSAPELIKGEDPSFASDQYSLASLLKTLVEKAKKEFDFKKSELSQGMVKALEKALDPLPEERYKDMHAFLRAFNTGYKIKNKNSNQNLAQASQNARKQDPPMDYSEIPPEYLNAESLTSGAESALSQAISSSAADRAFYEGTGFSPMGSQLSSGNQQGGVANPYPMWSGISSIEAQSHAQTMRVGVGTNKPSITVEDFDSGSGKSSRAEKDLAMRNIPKFKPGFDPDLSESAAKFVETPFAVDEPQDPVRLRGERLRVFLLALGLVALILIGVTVALLGGNTDRLKLPGSKNVSANLEFNGLYQSTLVKADFPTATLVLQSNVVEGTAFPQQSTSEYTGKGGGLTLSPTPSPTVTNTPEPVVPGAYATAPAEGGFFFDVQMGASLEGEPADQTPVVEPIDARGGAQDPYYFDVVIQDPLGSQEPSPTELSTQTSKEAETKPQAEEAPALTGSAKSEEVLEVARAASIAGPEPALWDVIIDQAQTPVPGSGDAPTQMPAVVEPSPQPSPDPAVGGVAEGAYPVESDPTTAPATQNPVDSPVATPIPNEPAVSLPTQATGSSIAQPTAVHTPKPTPIPLLAGAPDTGTTLIEMPAEKTELVVNLHDNSGKPLADIEVMLIPVIESPAPAIDTPLLKVEESVIPMPGLPATLAASQPVAAHVARSDQDGRLIFGLDPGSFHLVYLPNGSSPEPEAYTQYSLALKPQTLTELTIEREMVHIELVNLEGQTVILDNLGLVRKPSANAQTAGTQGSPVPSSQPVIPLKLAELKPQERTGVAKNGAARLIPLAEQRAYETLDLSPGVYELVQISPESPSSYTPLGIDLQVTEGPQAPIKLSLGRLVLPASFLEASGEAGQTIRILPEGLQTTTEAAPAAAAELVYGGEAVVKVDLLPGTYTVEWAGSSQQNLEILSAEATDLYIGPKGGK